MSEINNNDIPFMMGFSFSAVPPVMYQERENNQKKIIDWGIDNLYSQFILSLLSMCPLHASIIHFKANCVGGSGWLKTNLNPQTMAFLMNSRNEDDLDTILYQISQDLELYNGFALNIIWSKDRSKIAEINYIPISKIRIEWAPKKGKDGEINYEYGPQAYWFSDDWANCRKKQYEPKRYVGFSTTNKRNANQILMVKLNEPDTEWYPLPTYRSAINQMQTWWEIGRYHNKELQNGFMAGSVIIFPVSGNMTDEQKNQLAMRLNGQFQGVERSQVPMYLFPKSGSPESMPQIIPIETNASDSRFILLRDSLQEDILRAHEISGALMGIETAGKLGRDEHLEEMEKFQISYVNPRQNLIEKVFKWIAQINGITDNLIIKTYVENYRKMDDISQVLEVLQADMLPYQKYQALIMMGYTHDTSGKLAAYGEYAQPDQPIKDPPKADDITTPEKINPQI